MAAIGRWPREVNGRERLMATKGDLLQKVDGSNRQIAVIGECQRKANRSTY